MTRYREALAWLYGLESRGIKLGLERIRSAAELRGHPESALRHVTAGTIAFAELPRMLPAEQLAPAV